MKPEIKYLLVILAILLVIRIFQELILLPVSQKVVIEPSFTEPKVSDLTIGILDKSGKTVIFDQRKSQHSIFSDYSQFAAIFTEAKFEIRSIEKNFTDETRKAHVLVLLSPDDEYTETEIEAIKEYVGDGGTLIILGERDSIEVLNKVAINFGIAFNDDLVYDTERYTITSNYPLIGKFAFSPLTKGLSDISLISGCSLSLTPQSKVLSFSGKTTKSTAINGNLTLMAAAEFGSGKIFSICDTDLFSNKFLKYFDHGILARNLVNWS